MTSGLSFKIMGKVEEVSGDTKETPATKSGWLPSMGMGLRAFDLLSSTLVYVFYPNEKKILENIPAIKSVF